MTWPAMWMYVVLLAVCALASLTDIRAGKIYNRHLIWGVCAGAPGWFAYYLICFRDLLPSFFINFLSALLVSGLFYKQKIWGAGDSKLWLFVCLFFPYEGYLIRERLLFPLMDMLMIVFVTAYGYTLIETAAGCVKRRISGKAPSDKGMRETTEEEGKTHGRRMEKHSIDDFFFSYFLLRLFYRICQTAFGEYFRGNYIFFVLIGLFVMLAILGKGPGRRLRGIVLGAGAALLLYDGIWIARTGAGGNVAVNFVPLLIACTVILLRQELEKFNYASIPTKDVRKGMVLSAETVLRFRNSRVQGLPALADESAKCRMTEEEAEAVRRWETSKFGRPTVTTVIYFPFAIFISIGLLVYTAAGWWIYG